MLLVVFIRKQIYTIKLQLKISQIIRIFIRILNFKKKILINEKCHVLFVKSKITYPKDEKARELIIDILLKNNKEKAAEKEINELIY